MPTPTKPFSVLTAEGKSHRTKAELESRQAAEDALLSGVPMKMWTEVRADKVAAREFKRIQKLLRKIEKDDALHEGVINRYALLRSECAAFEEKRNQRSADMDELQRQKADGEIDFAEYAQIKEKIIASMLSFDRQIQAKRKMLLDIEKENIMTLASALRSIPKTPEKKEKSPMAEFLEKRKKES